MSMLSLHIVYDNCPPAVSRGESCAHFTIWIHWESLHGVRNVENGSKVISPFDVVTPPTITCLG